MQPTTITNHTRIDARTTHCNSIWLHLQWWTVESCNWFEISRCSTTFHVFQSRELPSKISWNKLPSIYHTFGIQNCARIHFEGGVSHNIQCTTQSILVGNLGKREIVKCSYCEILTSAVLLSVGLQQLLKRSHHFSFLTVYDSVVAGKVALVWLIKKILECVLPFYSIAELKVL